MGVFERAEGRSSRGAPEREPYVCVSCEAAFEVQYHSCPVCGSYDVRRAKWLDS